MVIEKILDFERKFRQKELLLAEIGAWTLSVRPGQLTLGAMVLASNSGALGMASLSDSELQDMGRGLALAEKLAIKAFGAQRINYLCLMMQDPIVHFHILPRYSKPVERFGINWRDKDWPEPPHIFPASTEDVILHEIKMALCMAMR